MLVMRMKMNSPDNFFYRPEIKVLLCRNDRLISGSWNHADLSAPFWRIYVNATPGATVHSDSIVYKLAPGQMLLISPDTRYSSSLERDVDHFYIHFQAASPFADISGKIYSFELTSCDLSRIKKISEGILQPPVSSISISLEILALCHQALAKIPEQDLICSGYDPRVADAINYIEANFQHTITNQMLANGAGMSVNSFARLFKTQTGLPPQAFLSRHRIAQACIMLRFSKLGIDEIAAASGFCDRHYLTRVFTTMRNISPVAFRKLHY